ncbi:helix-turn-helix transcriptional regulator [Virgibacillus sediminis]|uniref:Helix-turn-helix transcriptional regulator n=1 Tax=Virgibacillus sediminis TaxID=202260 RepID=A0ABV7A519_9BACI
MNSQELQEFQKALGKQILTYRKKKMCTQEQLAYEVGVTSNYIDRLENGKEDPAVNLYFQLCITLNAPFFGCCHIKQEND